MNTYYIMLKRVRDPEEPEGPEVGRNVMPRIINVAPRIINENFNLTNVDETIHDVTEIINFKSGEMAVRDSQNKDFEINIPSNNNKQIEDIIKDKSNEASDQLSLPRDNTELLKDDDIIKKIEREIELLNCPIDYYEGGYSEDTRIRILNAGILAIKKEVQNIKDQEQLDRMKLYVYNWGVTKMSQLLRLGQKTIGFLTLLGLCSMYFPPQLLQSLPASLQPLINLSQTIKPVVVGAQVSGATIITGYYILIKSGFEKNDIDNFFEHMKDTLRNTSSITSIISENIRVGIPQIIINLIDLTKNFFTKKLDELNFSYSPSPPELPSPIPSLSQQLYENVKEINNELDKILQELASQRQQLNEIEMPSSLETSLESKIQELNSSQLAQSSQSIYTDSQCTKTTGGRRHKRKTHRRRSTKRRRSSLHRKRRHTNRRRSRRSRRYHRR